MKKNQIFVFSFVAVFFFAINDFFAQVYNLDELQNLRDFLIQESNFPDGPYKENYPKHYHCISGNAANNIFAIAALELLEGSGWQSDHSWVSPLKGITFTEGRISKIEWRTGVVNSVDGLRGVLDLNNCSQLTSFTCTGGSNKLTELYLNGTSLPANGSIDVKNNALTKFEITNVNTVDDQNVPALFLPDPFTSGIITSGIQCQGNKLTFVNMPKMRIIVPYPLPDYPNDAANLYSCSGQDIYVNQDGDPASANVDLNPLYGVAIAPYTTVYDDIWYTSSSFATPATPQPAKIDNGVYLFPSEAVGITYYCKITNPLFSLKVEGGNPLYDYAEDVYGEYGFIGYKAAQCNLTLCYQTTITEELTVVSLTESSAAIYFSSDILHIKDGAVSVQSVSVFDISGKQLFTGTFNENYVQVNASTWQNGVYIVKVTSGAGMYIQKILK